MCKNPEIKSFAFLDLETTNLPDNNYGKVKILELSIYSCLRRDIILSNDGEIPRTTHKLTLYFNPLLQINPYSSNISNLYNDMLEPENPFNENAGNLIINFLQHLQKPVCLVAHNGFNFDFPILKKSLEKIDINIPDFILCIDSLEMIRKIDEIEKLEEKHNDEENDDDDDAAELVAIDNNDIELKKDHQSNKSNQTEIIATKSNADVDDYIDSRQKLNETTPKQNKITTNIMQFNKRKLMNNNNNDRNVNDIINNQLDETDDGNVKVKNQFKSKRKLIFSSELNNSSTRSTQFTSSSSSTTIPKKKFKPAGYYKLPTIFKRIFNKNPDVLHHAEDDVQTLQKIFISPKRHKFLRYADENAIKFSDIQIQNNFTYIRR